MIARSVPSLAIPSGAVPTVSGVVRPTDTCSCRPGVAFGGASASPLGTVSDDRRAPPTALLGLKVGRTDRPLEAHLRRPSRPDGRLVRSPRTQPAGTRRPGHPVLHLAGPGIPSQPAGRPRIRAG